jgi:predicted  nucleic acid-binding Zn-ribbon protein
MATSSDLFDLQRLDVEMEQRRTQLVNSRRRLEGNGELRQLEAALSSAQSDETKATSDLRTLEGDLTDLEGKIQRDNTRLYAGTIVDSRELASLERELANYRGRRNELEERVLAAMERVETAQQHTLSLSRELVECREKADADRPQVERDVEDLTAHLTDLETRRAAAAAALDARSLSLYERVQRASGHAVSRVSNGVCEWCRVSLPAKDVQHARSGAVVTCSNCGRILYTG